jgi:hypothetical protein
MRSLYANRFFELILPFSFPQLTSPPLRTFSKSLGRKGRESITKFSVERVAELYAKR